MTSAHYLPPHILALSLPHLLQQIAYWIRDPKYLAACVLVNKAWHDAIIPVLWRYFFRKRQRKVITELSPAIQRAARRNACHVRYLVARSTTVFEHLGPDCTRLRKLTYDPNRRPPPHAVQDLIQCLEKQRPSGTFEAFSTTLFPFGNAGQAKSLLESVPESVQTLEICSLYMDRISPEGLMVLFHSCASKRHLQNLTIEMDFDQIVGFEGRLQSYTAFLNHMKADQETMDTTVDKQLQQQHPNTLTLKQLTLTGILEGLEDSILFPLLKLCPNLETLDIPLIYPDRSNDLATILREHCPRLKCLFLDQTEFNDEQVSHLIDVGIRGTLDQITVSGTYNYNTGRRVLEMSELGTQRALLQQVATLEVLHLHDCGLALTSTWIQQVLVQCSNLKELRIKAVIVRPYPDDNTTAHIPLTNMGRQRRALVGLDAMDIIQGESWTCSNLRVMELVIRNVPRSERRPSQGMRVGMDAPQRQDMDEYMLHEEPVVMAEAESHAVQRQICQRIGAFKQLQELRLGLFDVYKDEIDSTVYVEPIQNQCLELSLETGLEELANLKELRQLNIVRMDHAMGTREIEWIVREGVWPKLKLINGVADEMVRTPLGSAPRRSLAAANHWYLKAKFWMEWATVQDNPAEWLCRQRPGLVVNKDELNSAFD